MLKKLIVCGLILSRKAQKVKKKFLFAEICLKWYTVVNIGIFALRAAVIYGKLLLVAGAMRENE